MTPATPTPVIAPPDVLAAVGLRVHPGRADTVVRYTAEMLGTAFMAAYPWTPAHGWAASN
ncbi:MAG: hypothetical protein ABW060_12805 [Solirubrobacteraceae bacterium]